LAAARSDAGFRQGRAADVGFATGREPAFKGREHLPILPVQGGVAHNSAPRIDQLGHTQSNAAQRQAQPFGFAPEMFDRGHDIRENGFPAAGWQSWPRGAGNHASVGDRDQARGDFRAADVDADRRGMLRAGHYADPLWSAPLLRRFRTCGPPAKG